MKPLFGIAMAAMLAVSGGVFAADTHNVPPEGFVALFNGKDLAGWRGASTVNPLERLKVEPKLRATQDKASLEDINKHWRVENGEIINDGQGLYLTTDRDYGDYELRVDFKLTPKADSGIYLRGVPQVQIWDFTEAGGHWKLGADKGSGGLWNNPADAPGKNPSTLADKPIGEWNTFRITIQGDDVTVVLNDKTVVEKARLHNYFNKGQSLLPVGPIQLQTHGSEMRWRNVFLKEIPQALPAAGKLSDGKPSGEGWQQLLANDLSGWKHTPSFWSLKEGVLKGDYQGGAKHEYLYSEKEYGDFELHAVVKMSGEGANSGVCIRTKPTDTDNVPGYQVDMGPGFWGCLWDERRDGMVAAYPKALADKLVKADDFNHYYVIARGPHIQAWLNGVKTIDVVHPRGIPSGSLAFQLCHGKKRTQLDVKSLWIRELK